MGNIDPIVASDVYYDTEGDMLVQQENLGSTFYGSVHVKQRLGG